MCDESHCGGAAADVAARVCGVECLRSVGLQLPSHDWMSMALARKGTSDTADQLKLAGATHNMNAHLQRQWEPRPWMSRS